MSKDILRQKLHAVIEGLEDTSALQKLYTDALEYKYVWMEDNPLTDDEWDQVSEGLAQLRNDEPCTHQAALQKFKEWQQRK